MSFSPRTTTNFTLGTAIFALLAVGGLSTPAVARDWLVPEQAPTIQAAVDSCVQGDVVVISPGVYNDCTNLSENVYHIAVLKSGVDLRGATGDPADVILDAEGNGRILEMRNLSGETEIEGLTLRRGRAVNPFGSGGGVFAYQSDPVFRSCVFDSNSGDYAGGAICVLYGGLTVEDCVFVGNETANLGGAIRLSNSAATITGTTIHGTIGEAIHYSNEDLTLERCLVTGGDEQAIVQNSTTDPEPSLSCTNLYDNDEDWSDFFSDQADSNNNLSVDPLYCNPLFGELTLYVSSPCAADNNPDCGRIGALPAVCGTGSAYHIVRADGSGDFPTIQDAINAAAISDTVALADGVFTGPGNRNLDFLGKAITVMGQSGDPALAVIDCQGGAGDPQRGFHFHSSEMRFSILRDLTITNADVVGDGAAILCESSPWIENCVFEANHADRGAAIWCDGGSPEVVDCTFARNEGRQQAGGIGAFGSDAVVRGCTFTGNWGAQGAAVFLPDSCSVRLENCTLTRNNCALDKGMVSVDGTSQLVLDHTIISYGNRHAVRCYDEGLIFANDSNLFGNATSDWSSCLAGRAGSDGNISADPRYCDPDAEDFTLRSDSPCSETSAPDGELVGAHAVGCDAPPIFADVSPVLAAAPARSRGAAWADIDADGDLDCSIANLDGANETYLGDGDGGFALATEGALLFPGTNACTVWGDWNNDGDLDMYLGNPDIVNLLVDVEDSVYSYLTPAGTTHSGPAGGSAWLDFDNDGHLDLFIAATDSTSALLRSDGEGGFAADASFAELETDNVQQMAGADYDNDGDRDLYLVQDGAANLLIRNGDDFATATAGPAGDEGAGRAAAWGDYDQDGDLDLYLVNDGGENFLFENRNGSSFVDAGTGALTDDGPGRSGIWGDWDNDGDLDLFVSNCGAADRLLRNEGDDLFVDVSDPAFAAPDSSVGAAWGDYDRDGDLDLLVADQMNGTRLYRNDQDTGNHWLQVDLVHAHGAPGCPGARVRVVTGDTVQIREVAAGGGWLSHDASTVHFGLGAATIIDTLEITLPHCFWPVQTDVAVDQRLVLVGSVASPVWSDDGDLPALTAAGFETCYPNPFNPATTIRFSLPRAGAASLTVYDVAGRLVRTVFNEPRPAGTQQVVWRGCDEAGRQAASGVYYLLLAGERVKDVRSVVLLK